MSGHWHVYRGLAFLFALGMAMQVPANLTCDRKPRLAQLQMLLCGLALATSLAAP